MHGDVHPQPNSESISMREKNEYQKLMKEKKERTNASEAKNGGKKTARTYSIRVFIDGSSHSYVLQTLVLLVFKIVCSHTDAAWYSTKPNFRDLRFFCSLNFFVASIMKISTAEFCRFVFSHSKSDSQQTTFCTCCRHDDGAHTADGNKNWFIPFISKSFETWNGKFNSTIKDVESAYFQR